MGSQDRPKNRQDGPKTGQDRPKTVARRPKTAPRRSQDGPRPPQDGPKTAEERPKTLQDCQTLLCIFPKLVLQKVMKNQWKINAFDLPNQHNIRSKRAPRPPKIAQDSLKMTPRGPKKPGDWLSQAALRRAIVHFQVSYLFSNSSI
jgi:hypothetical protein